MGYHQILYLKDMIIQDMIAKLKILNFNSIVSFNFKPTDFIIFSQNVILILS